MPRLVVLYPQPADAAAFERSFAEEHVPLVRAQLNGVRRLHAARVHGSPGFHWMAEMHFDTMDELRRASQSDGGLRAQGHARQISTGGDPLILVVDDAPDA